LGFVVGQVQAPAVQTLPPVQATPHVPQLRGSVAVVVQTAGEPQAVWPAGHWVLQPSGAGVAEQIWPAAQTVVQLPQAVGSVFVFLQVPEQSVRPVGQLQALLVQVLPPVHATPQVPQLLLSDVRVAQTVPHSVWPVGQVPLHWPVWQVWPVGHLVPQAPQLFGS
jgi:hypothetical protein